MAVSLSELLAVFQRLAPLEFAESWDNVGLLLEPVAVSQVAPLERVLLTIDLSEAVVGEAEQLGAKLIVAYHPPIFQGLKRLRATEPAERVLLRCLARGIAVYSPHTALDAAPGGVNDWLLDAFGAGDRKPCVPNPVDPRFGQGRAVQLDAPIGVGEAITRIKQQLGLTQL
ncbi:MAG TPA: Nif3-like dinuclear metal center hexameric protein, partial [Polyangiaceae bacterium]|nr:Nif3-like dinuclear metal center hexameric protein [Polyangiaceae bacterium]